MYIQIHIKTENDFLFEVFPELLFRRKKVFVDKDLCLPKLSQTPDSSTGPSKLPYSDKF